jgi:ATP-dependent Clp protease ATP-binding subunit ClpA
MPPLLAISEAAPSPPGSSGRERLAGLRAHLEANIRGQRQIMERVASVLTRGELGLAHPGRPKGSFLFVGPTGVGKTELTNVFTAHLFDGRKPIRFDMSEYQNQSSVEKLIGQEAGEIGLLGRALSGISQGSLLFDEIEKAHPLVLDLFLQMLDDASITFASGERKHLGQFYIVFTSNIGSGEVMRMTSAPMATVERTVLSRVGQQLRPELVGRITEKLVFGRLDFDTQREICELMIGRERARLRRLGFDFEMDDGVVEFLIRKGYHRSLGARPMRSVVERHLQDAIAQRLLSCESACGRLTVDSGTETLMLKV